MRPEEAAWIGNVLSRLDPSAVGMVLNIGSSTGHFRSVTQPHINSEIFRPLAARGSSIVHCDMKQAEGVDLVGDLFDPTFRKRVESLAADVVLATNLFEHVKDRESLAACLAALPNATGRLIVSVPYLYPYHADPIDTLYRPTPEEIAAMFPGFVLKNGAIIESTSLWHDLLSRFGPWGAAGNVARRLARLLFPFVRPRAWRATLSNLVWLRRKRSVSIACLVRRSRGDLAGGSRLAT